MKKIPFIVSFFFFLPGSCEDSDRWGDFIVMKNNSSLTIIVCGAYVLPDTLLPKETLRTTVILPEKSNTITSYSLGDNKLKRFKAEKISLFVLDEQVFQTMPWDTICKYNMVLKRYEINGDDYLNLVQYDGKRWALPYP